MDKKEDPTLRGLYTIIQKEQEKEKPKKEVFKSRFTPQNYHLFELPSGHSLIFKCDEEVYPFSNSNSCLQLVNELLLKVKEYHVDDVIERMFELGSCMIMKLSLPLSPKVDGDMSAYLNNYLKFIYTSKKEDLGMFFAAQTGDKESYFKILKKKLNEIMTELLKDFRESRKKQKNNK